MIKKYFIITFILIAGYGISPISIPIKSINPNKNQIRITRQECGCPCANSRIIGGKLTINENILAKYPEFRENQNEITATFDSFHKSLKGFFDIEGAESYILQGKVIGADTILCNPIECEIVPLFQVNKIQLSTYICKFWLFKPAFFIGYWILVVIAIVSIIISLIALTSRKN